MENVTTRMSDEELDLVDRLAEERGESRSEVIRDALKRGAREELVRLALQRYRDGAVGMRGAAGIAGLTIPEMMEEANERGTLANILAEVDEQDLIYGVEGRVVVPAAVRAEVTQDPAASELEAAIDRDDVTVLDTAEAMADLDAATDHLGRSAADEEPDGDVALLARALDRADPVVLTDDVPLRTACKALSIPVSGPIGVLIRAVERGAIGPETAKERLVAMDRVGARLSASLLRRAERLIDGAADR